MQHILLRLVSIMIAASLLLSFIPNIEIEAHAATRNQQNIADRADFFYNTTWVCQKTINGWRDQYTFNEGETYRLPYGQPVNSGKFIGYGVELEDFVIAAADVNSVFYSRQSEYNGWTSVYYATDCAAFVAMCWGTVRQDCSTLPYYSTYKGAPNESNIYNVLQLGDALDSTSVGHVVLVTDMVYDENGTLIQIEITEQTPPQLKRTYFTPSELAEKYGSAFGIYRYEGSVPDVPEWGYTAECTNYASYCQVELTQDTPIMSLPCSSVTNAESKQLGTASSGSLYTATRMYGNTASELWYRIKLADDQDGYIFAGDTVYKKQFLDDIALSDASYPNAHVRGKTFSLVGNLYSKYNQLYTAATYIYKGFGSDTSPVTGYSDYATSNAYTLKSSTIDYNTSFGSLSTGQYTIAISSTYRSYYATSGTTYEVNSGTIELAEEYFMVVSSVTNQSSCNHAYNETVLSEGSCTDPGLTVYSCNACGKVYKEENAAKGHQFGEWSIDEATCTEAGSQVRVCSLCGEKQTEIIEPIGHKYSELAVEGSCTELPHTLYTCDDCGDSYIVYAEEIMSDWQADKPLDIDDALIESKTQYRYRDMEIISSTEEAPDGYTFLDETWEVSDTKQIDYVQTWPDGFDTGHALYSEYGREILTDAENDKEKLTVDSDTVTGYLYYHWCYRNSYYSKSKKEGNYNIFHAYYSTTEPGTYRVDTSDWSYCTSDSGCSNTEWYFVAEVHTQSSTLYHKLKRYSRWTEFSNWSDTEVTATEDRQVETRTVYRYAQANSASHSYETERTEATCTEDGLITYLCSLCGHSYEESIPASGHSYESERTEATCTEDGLISYHCSLCGHSYEESIPAPGHSYVDKTCQHCGMVLETVKPIIIPRYPTISFEDEIVLNVYFTVENQGSISMSDMGLITWTAPQNDGNIANANSISCGATLDHDNGFLAVQSQGIPAKNLGDSIYFKIYIKLADGSYVYSNQLNYSPKAYANSILTGTSYSAKMKSLAVAMLNYGAAAQTYFNYKPYDLMNADLDPQYQALVSEYSADMVASVTRVDSTKLGSFASTATGFSKRYPTISFEGAFSINYYFTPNKVVDGDITLYFWNQSDYEAAEQLEVENATSAQIMTGESEFWAAVTNIAAKEIDRTVFVCAVYTDINGVTHCSGVLNYSIGAYCVSQAAGTLQIAPFAAATAVYGYYAKNYFAS